MKLTRAFVEQCGYQVIYGDTDSLFIWLKRPHSNAEAHAVAASRVQDINAWWTRKLREEQQLENFLEIEFDTHYAKFFMPTIRGSDVGSKKRYAGLSVDEEGREDMVYRGLEMARSDWTPGARQFQEGLLSRIEGRRCTLQGYPSQQRRAPDRRSRREASRHDALDRQEPAGRQGRQLIVPAPRAERRAGRFPPGLIF